MKFIDFIRIMFCGCCQPELFMFSSSSESTQTSCLEKRDDIFKNDSDSLIPPGSSQVKYTFAVEDTDDSDSLSVDSIDTTDSANTYSSVKTNTSTENNNDAMRASFDSNDSWEIMIENNSENTENIKYI
tara:strand:- start:224 stop:610 length:387 start_codon:yes stop_codon:yes gene_type:complete